MVGLGAAFARIWIYNGADDTLVLRASAGLYTHLDGAHSRVPVGMYKIGLIASERAPHLTNAVLDDPRVGDQAWARREGMVAFAGYPLIVGERLVGVMALFARTPLGDETLQSLGNVAAQIALAIDRDHVDRFREVSSVCSVMTCATLSARSSRELSRSHSTPRFPSVESALLPGS